MALLNTVRSTLSRPPQDAEQLDVGGVPGAEKVAEPEHRERGNHHAAASVARSIEALDEQDVTTQ